MMPGSESKLGKIHAEANPVVAKLKAALGADGDFPARAKVVSELRRLINDPNTPLERIVEIIIGEPSLGTRVLHLVNSVIYSRAHQVTTISQAIVQLGLQALQELCSSLVLLQRFSGTAQKGGIFADNMKKCLLTSVITLALSKKLGREDEQDNERGYLAGTFFSMGSLLLAYYFPQVFENAQKRAEARKQTVTQSISELIGLPPICLSLEIVETLSIPHYYKELLTAASEIYLKPTYDYSGGAEVHHLARPLAIGAKVAELIIDTSCGGKLMSSLANVAHDNNMSLTELKSALRGIPEAFRQSSKIIDMNFLNLPQHFIDFLEADSPHTEYSPEEDDSKKIETRLIYYLEEIRQAITNNEAIPSIIATTMEALVFGAGFDRVVLLDVDKKNNILHGKMSLGDPFDVDIKLLHRNLSAPNLAQAPDKRAFDEGLVEIYGDPIFESGWPFAAIPVGSKSQSICLLYADILNSPAAANPPLNTNAIVAVSMLKELLDEAVRGEN